MRRLQRGGVYPAERFGATRRGGAVRQDRDSGTRRVRRARVQSFGSRSIRVCVVASLSLSRDCFVVTARRWARAVGVWLDVWTHDGSLDETRSVAFQNTLRSSEPETAERHCASRKSQIAALSSGDRHRPAQDRARRRGPEPPRPHLEAGTGVFSCISQRSVETETPAAPF